MAWIPVFHSTLLSVSLRVTVSDNEVRMLLTKPGAFEVRNKSCIVLAGKGCKAKFHTNISRTLPHSQNVCTLPHNLKLVTAAVAHSQNFTYPIIYLIWLGSLDV